MMVDGGWSAEHKCTLCFSVSFFCPHELKVDHHYCSTAALPGKREDLAVHGCETCHTGDGECCEDGRGGARVNLILKKRNVQEPFLFLCASDQMQKLMDVRHVTALQQTERVGLQRRKPSAPAVVS